MAINKYPYTSYNEYNLDWIIKKIRELDDSMRDYEALHSIQFGGDWDISKQYEQWTIVSDPVSHDGYLSLKPVPNNVQLTNTEYWLKIADYTTGLASVNARVDAVEDDIDDNIKPDIDAIEADITDNIKPDIDAIEADITDNIKPDITNLQDKVKKRPRKIIIFGDSYFEDVPPSGDTNFRTCLTNCLANVPNVEFELNSQGGEGFGWTGADAGYNFLYDVQTYTTSFDPEEVTDIFFVGGYNDRNHSASDIYNGMSSSFSLCHTKYPNAYISVGHFGWSGTLNSTARDAIINYSLPSWTNCTRYGAGYMTNAEFTMHDYDLFYDTDRFHPNGTGHMELARQITNYIVSGTCDVHYRYKNIAFNQGTVTGAFTDTQYNIGFKLDNEQITIYFPDANIVYDSANTGFNMSVDSYSQMMQTASMVIGQKGYALGMYDNAKHVGQVIPLRGYIQTASSTFKTLVECQCILSGGFLYVRPFGVDNSGYKTYTGVYAIHLIGGAYTIPTLSC